MKIKRVAALCNQAGRYNLLDQYPDAPEDGTQWLGDGCAIYPLGGLPYMNEDSLCIMLDISEKKRDKLVMRHSDAPDYLCLKDVDQYELEVAQPALVMRYEGMELLPLKTSAGLVFIQEKYLSPLDELEYMRLFERRSGGGGVYIVAKVGMLLQAVILPVDVVCDRLVYQLGELTELCRDAMVENNLSAWKEDQNDPETGRQRSLFQVDEETGEVVEE